MADDQLQFSRIPTRETMWPPMICEIGGLRVRGRMKGKTKEKGVISFFLLAWRGAAQICR